MTTPPPPGWYQDPATGSLRWWDGTAWTEHTTPPVPVAQAPATPSGPFPGVALASMILAIVAWLFVVFPLLPLPGQYTIVLLAVAAMVCGIIGLIQSKRIRRGKAMAITGIVLSGLGLLLAVVPFILF